MAVIKSSKIDRLEAGHLSGHGQDGFSKRKDDLITTTGVVADNDVIATSILIPVDAPVHSIKAAFDDLGTTGDLNLGLYNGETDVDDLVHTAAIDEDCFAAAIDVNAAAVALTEYRFSALGIETGVQKAWELAGLSARPTTYNHFRVCFTASEATTAAGDIFISVAVGA
jgi:hypothetical protein